MSDIGAHGEPPRRRGLARIHYLTLAIVLAVVAVALFAVLR